MSKSAANEARELLRRRRVRGSLAEWARHNGYEPARHHCLLIDHLEKVERGEIKRLLVMMPPGSAKSTYCSKLFPAWFLARNPGKSIVSASHTSLLAERWGRWVRNSVSEFHKILRLELSSDSSAAGRWSLQNGSEFLAVGAGGGVTGFRADLAILDDVVRGREDAESELIRSKTWEWYRSDLCTRLRPGGAIVAIGTRWHTDDLLGRLLTEMETGGEKWTVISLPAQAIEGDPLGRQPGEWLWSDGDYGFAQRLQEEQKAQSPRNWASLYQQTPVVPGGNYFLEGWFRPYFQLPDDITHDDLRTYIGTDFAVTSKAGDYSVIVAIGVDHRGDLYLLDLYREQASSDEWTEVYLDMMARWKPLQCCEESGQIAAGVGPFITRRMMERRVYAHRQQYPSRHDKAIRARSIQGLLATRGLYVPVRAAWWPTVLAELLGFPSSKHDDVVDALSLVGQMLVTLGDGKQPESAKATPIWHLKEPQPVTLNRLWNDYNDRPLRRERI